MNTDLVMFLAQSLYKNNQALKLEDGRGDYQSWREIEQGARFFPNSMQAVRYADIIKSAERMENDLLRNFNITEHN
jgi:hypothetical protein